MDRPTDEPNGPPREPGEPRRRLERAPGERFGQAAEPAPQGPASFTRRAGTVRALAVAATGSVLIAVLGGPLSVTVGLIAVVAVVGWAIGSYVGRPAAIAVGLALASVAIGLAGIWLFARSEGGVLDPVTYLADVHGPLVLVDAAVAAIAAWVGARPPRPER
jgi:hypothetical protein